MPWLTTIGAAAHRGRPRRWRSLAGIPRTRRRVPRLVRPLDGARAHPGHVRAQPGARVPVRRRPGRHLQFSEVHSWIPQFGVSYAVGVDGIALTLVLLSTVLMPVCVLAVAGASSQAAGPCNFFALMLVLET